MIDRSTSFKRDYKRVKATPQHNKLDILKLARLGSHSELFS